MLREFQISFTIDTASQRSSAYILECVESGAWSWIADTEFGPFDTVLDVSRWLTRALVKRKALSLR